MNFNEYKKTALGLLAQPLNSDRKNHVIGVTSSNDAADTYDIAMNIAAALASMSIPTTVINGCVKDETNIALSDNFESMPLVNERSFKLSRGAAITPQTAAVSIAEITSPFCIIALDGVALHTPAMIFAACCDGLLFAETLKTSRSDEIDKAFDAAKCLNVAPVGFITVKK